VFLLDFSEKCKKLKKFFVQTYRVLPHSMQKARNTRGYAVSDGCVRLSFLQNLTFYATFDVVFFKKILKKAFKLLK